MAGCHDRQRVGERTECLFGANVGELDLKSESLGSVTDEFAVAEQVEWGELQLIAAQPRLDGDIGPDTRGLAGCQREGPGHASTIFDHRGFADFLQIRFRLRLEFLGIHLIPDFPFLRRVNGGRLPCA